MHEKSKKINEVENSVNYTTEQSNIEKIKNLFKDKKNIIIAVLAVLLLFSFNSSPSTTTFTNEINELKSQIEQLSSNNNELNTKLEESNSKNKELESKLKQLQEENQQLKSNVSEQKSEIPTPVDNSATSTDAVSNNEPIHSNEEETSTFILNKNTKVFHKPGCSSISKMKDSNKEEYNGSRDSVISKGYKPCQRCNP